MGLNKTCSKCFTRTVIKRNAVSTVYLDTLAGSATWNTTHLNSTVLTSVLSDPVLL
jgi:hypothetical protein